LLIILKTDKLALVSRRNTTHASGRVGLQDWTVNESDKGGGSQLQPDPVSARVVRVTNSEFHFLGALTSRRRMELSVCILQAGGDVGAPRDRKGASHLLIVTVRAAWFRLRLCSKRR
jgi:hypothetical protein